jgi:hypothetical protein
MNKAIVILIILALTIVMVGVAYALVTYTSSHPSTVTPITPTVAITETFNGATVQQNAPLNFGSAVPIGTTTYPLHVTNIGNVPATLTITYAGLPNGWTLISNVASLPTLQPSASADITLTLTIPNGTPNTQYSWTTTLTATQAP